jgi:hypothetical protein
MICYLVGIIETGILWGRLSGGWREFYIKGAFLLLGKYH